ncbi:MAG: UbiA family prenyltransferase [Acidobacteriota bacterium]
MNVRPWISMARPFTLVPPFLGILSGAACAWASAHNPHAAFTWALFWQAAIAACCAALMNAASNFINQVYDVEIDRVNKPHRPLVRGVVAPDQAAWGAAMVYFASIVPIWFLVPPPHDADFLARIFAPLRAHVCFWIYLGMLLCTLVYSVPKLGRTKRFGVWANVTIAVARGELVQAGGWALFAPVALVEPWYLGSVFFFYILGTASTKDFSDVEGDRIGGCRTLPVVYGPAKAARMISPAFVMPWLMFPLGTCLPAPGDGRILSGSPALLVLLAAVLILCGVYALRMILRHPHELASVENHPSWMLMYATMIIAQVGLGLAYLLR